MPREMLYAADELFYAGTAVEISPIASVDRITVGKGERGPITQGDPGRVLRHRARRGAGPSRLAGLRAASRRPRPRAAPAARAP